MSATEKFYEKLNASELSAILLMKGSSMSADRDAGFCSGSSEGGDDLLTDHSRMEPHSPTDASEDSVEVKVTPITIARNKRKSTEPSRVVCEQESLGPLKKRIRYTSTESGSNETEIKADPFRPWDQRDFMMLNPAEVLARHPGVTTLHRAPVDVDVDIQDQPLALVAKKPNSLSLKAPQTLQHTRSCDVSTPNKIVPPSAPIPASISSSSSNSSTCGSQRPQQRNYKNMTRERRIEANARERTRVHTISAAYDTLRKAIPSYSHTQKLSKLSVLRVACSYILSLSRMAGEDYSADQSSPSIAECFDMVTKTIQTEGKIRKKKDE